MSIDILESFVAGSGTSCADVIVAAPGVVGVVDGATAKPWDSAGGPSGERIAIELADVLAGLPRDFTAVEAVSRLTAHVAGMLAAASIRPGAGSGAAFAVVHLGARQIWRVGEANLMVNTQLVGNRARGETIVARARALVIRALLADGASVEELQRVDAGREAIYGVLKALVSLRNRDVGGYMNAAVDGTPVPAPFLEIVDLPNSECEVVMTSDGYPTIARTLAETEELLHLRLATDPLMIEEPPATKGWMVGQSSFDDRAFVRCLVPAIG